MHKRKSTDAQLRTELIGLSPLPGSPPAAYGSIIIPCACHGHHRGATRFVFVSVLFARIFQWSWRTYELSLKSPSAQGRYLSSVYSVFKVHRGVSALHIPTARFGSKNESKKRKNLKKFLQTKKEPLIPRQKGISDSSLVCI